MSYCTQADILEQLDEDELIRLTDDAGSGSVDSSVISRAIEDADAEIDAYCTSRHDVPFSTVPAIVRKLSVDMAVYNLFTRRMGATDDRQKRYDAAVRLLKDIARGIVSIGASASVLSDAGAISTRSGSDRVFSNDGLAGF